MAEPSAESDMRRRAAWLLVMLALVAVLVVVVMTTLLDTSGNNGGSGIAGPDDTLSPTPSRTSTTSPATRRSTGTAPATGTSSSGPATGTSPSGPATSSCPSDAPCALEGDSGAAIPAINAYRAQHGRTQVPGTVSKAAQTCALSNGSNCNGGWAETFLGKLDGAAAVAKIAHLGKLLDPNMTSFEIGWAYAPKQQTYYFAIVRND